MIEALETRTHACIETFALYIPGSVAWVVGSSGCALVRSSAVNFESSIDVSLTPQRVT